MMQDSQGSLVYIVYDSLLEYRDAEIRKFGLAFTIFKKSEKLSRVILCPDYHTGFYLAQKFPSIFLYLQVFCLQNIINKNECNPDKITIFFISNMTYFQTFFILLINFNLVKMVKISKNFL